MTVPAQEFQIGQRVRHHGEQPFVINYIRLIDGKVAYSMLHRPWYFASALTLAPERPPYVASERRTVSCLVTVYRCETDAKLAARHAAERAKYDAQGDEA